MLLALTCALMAVGAVAATPREERPRDAAAAGRIVGRITYEGDIPREETPDNDGVQHPLLRVNKKNAGVQFVVVYVSGLTQGDTAADASAGAAVCDDKLPTIDQRDYQFVPRVIAVRDGQTVRFSNNDAGNHNVRAVSLEPRNQFNVFTGANASYQHRFFADRKGRPVRIGCDLHHWMCAWVYVFEHPYYSVTDAGGQFALEGVPAGEHTVWVVQPDVGVKLSRKVVVRVGETGELSLKLTEAAFSRVEKRSETGSLKQE